MSLSASLPPDVRKLLTFGTGVGIQIGESDLEIAVARVRSSKVDVLGRLAAEGSPAELLADIPLLRRTNLVHAHRHSHAEGATHSHPHVHRPER